MIKLSPRMSLYWLALGPLLGLALSFPSWLFLEYLEPGKLYGAGDMILAYPLGLLMSLLTPWGWLMYGGLLLMHGDNRRAGVLCTLAGAIILGAFWPIWATDLVG